MPFLEHVWVKLKCSFFKKNSRNFPVNERTIFCVGQEKIGMLKLTVAGAKSKLLACTKKTDKYTEAK
jgi:hypothetical protein